jgi:hypothetical protein
VWRDCTDDVVGIVAALIEGSESDCNMLVILLSTHLYANTRSQLDYIARGLKYAKLWCLSGDRDPNPALHYVRVKERIYQAGASWVAWIKQRGAATRSTGYTVGTQWVLP